MAEKSRTRQPFLWGGLFCLAAFLTALQVAGQGAFRFTGLAAGTGTLDRAILLYGTLPRIAAALAAGAALGLCGHLLQRVLRNPLAEPTTLGIAAGAQLAMGAATIYLPAAMAWSREAVALGGGAAAAGLVIALTWRRGIEPVSVLLGGMMITLTASAASAALILANGEYMFSLFIWGGGSLVQQGWGATISITVTLAIVAALSLLLLRPLTILGLDDANAKSLGVALNTTRLLVIGLAVWLATTVTAELGVIGFVGLAAPALARLTGARTAGRLFAGSMLVGALVLWLTDSIVQLFSGAGGERIPTGAATALIGAPLLLWMLPRLSMLARPQMGDASAAYRAPSPRRLIVLLALFATVAILLAMAVGRGPEGWAVAMGELFADLAQWRGPRVVVAAMAGAMLAAAGVILQRLMGNPLASPEVLGVGAGAGVGLTAALFLFAAPGLPLRFGFSLLGAMIALALMLAIAAKARFGRGHLLLAGVAMGALCSAVLTSVIAMGNMQSFELLGWLSGSTNGATWADAAFAAGAAALLVLPLPLARRWLEILPLGDGTASALGLPERRCRVVLVTASALLTAAASLLVGPLSFVGLVAPHVARRIGLPVGLGHLAGAVLIGGGLMVVADWLGRMAAFPYQMPVGLFAALLSGPYLVWLLGRGVPSGPGNAT
ncbi:Fe(3+)-hydroxamate ABC transporter permease FhuB [Chelativorans xinjiangense]|uniref:Fe(3+)-hydroxamate ABC transporter permease FhuB n=1 Tax=Chelativorans xinjiangense TaxID=2681485 RepID=UPI00135A3028|nr:Fe(3+)-hydroxamate ABC transporter permease FhuB [Chelativorans xinjiangense]